MADVNWFLSLFWKQEPAGAFKSRHEGYDKTIITLSASHKKIGEVTIASNRSLTDFRIQRTYYALR